MQKKLRHAVKVVADAADSVASNFANSQVGAKVADAARSANREFQNSAVKQKLVDVQEGVSDHLDTLSGAKILQLVEERLEVQAKYNDILATKLDEALQRLAALEKKAG